MEELNRKVKIDYEGSTYEIDDGSVLIASISSYTNTSNPLVMLSAGKFEIVLEVI